MSFGIVVFMLIGAGLGGLVISASVFAIEKIRGGINDKYAIPAILIGALIGALIAVPFGINFVKGEDRATIISVHNQSNQLDEFITYANKYYEKNQEYGSLDAISLEFPEQFTDTPPLDFTGDIYSYSDRHNIHSNYRVNKIPTGAIINHKYSGKINIRILLRRGQIVGLSCTNLKAKAANLNLCKIAKQEIKTSSVHE